MFKKRILLIIVAIAGAIAAFQLTRGTASEVAIKPPPYEPAVRDKNGLISAAGLVESMSENTSLGSAYSGIVSEVNVKVWDKVNRGQPLLTLDRTEIKQQIEVQASIVRAAEAATERAKDQYDRWSSLKDTGAVSKSDLKNYELAREEAVAKLNTARSQLTQLEIMFRRYQINSPIDGTVLQVNVRKGEFVAAGQKAPIVVGNIEQLQIRCDVDEQLATRIREGLPAKGYLKG
ncbi:MAG: efflux RND transporter periplasmic adaptor subunit, partial [Opitutae bacterium]|nr:efflux RND transporter periplasmic adaptor subunit [Opitutae bacterium]